VLSREFQRRVGDFLYRLGVNVYEALIREWRTLEQLSVNPDGFSSVPIPAGPGLVHHSPSELRLVDYAQRRDHEIEIPEHAAQVLYALVFQIGNDDVPKPVPCVVSETSVRFSRARDSSSS
jgi:hypothetical protein